MVSLMLTAQKCATALRGACPALALDVASTVGRSRIQFPTYPGSHVWRDAPKSAAEWRHLCMKLGSKGLRSRLQDTLLKIGSDTAKAHAIQSVLEADDDGLDAVFGSAEPAFCRKLLSLLDEDLLPTGRRIGRFAKAEVVAAGQLVTFRPGGTTISSTGSSSSSSAWYTDEAIMLMTPWLTVVGRSIRLTGQILSDVLLLVGSSSMRRTQQQRSASASLSEVDAVDSAYVKGLLENANSCVEYLGSQQCHMQLAGDEPAEGSTSADGSGKSADGSAARMPLLTKLLEQHAQLQTGLYLAVQRCAAAGQPAARKFDINSAGAAALVQQVWSDSLSGQLSAFGAAVAAALPVGWACNNAACTNLAKLSELQLVRGKAKVCGGCKVVRMCSAECQRQHWQAGHKLVCKKLAAAAGEAASCSNSAAGGSSSIISAAAVETTAGSSNNAAGFSSCGSSGAGSSCSTSTNTAAPAAAGVELPSSAAAAAALPVHQLKALLGSLGVAGLAGAVEKND
jgi:hypothetical protein